MSKDSQQPTEEKAKAKDKYAEMSLQGCKQSIAVDARMNISDLSLIFNEARLNDARYYAWKFDRDSTLKLLGKICAGGGTILGTMASPHPSVLGAAFVAVAGVGLYIHGVRERRLALSHLRQDIAKAKEMTP